MSIRSELAALWSCILGEERYQELPPLQDCLRVESPPIGTYSSSIASPFGYEFNRSFLKRAAQFGLEAECATVRDGRYRRNFTFRARGPVAGLAKLRASFADDIEEALSGPW